jgi:hypothetical protein
MSGSGATGEHVYPVPLLTESKELKMNHQEASDKLYQIGFSASEIEC